MNHYRTLEVVGTVAVAGSFVATCTVPAGYYRGKYLEEGVTAGGPNLLVMGWGVMFLDPIGIGWFANPALALGLFGLWRGRFGSAARWAAAATALALIPPAELLCGWNPSIRAWPDPAVRFTLDSSFGVYAEAELRVGYFLWLAAHAFLCAAAAGCWCRDRNARAAGSGAEPAPPLEELTSQSS